MPTTDDLLLDTDDSDVARAVRAKLMADLATDEQFARGVKKGVRIVQNWRREKDPIPHTYIGRTPYIRVTPALAWLEKRFARDKQPRKVGRPRKQDV